MSQHKRSFGICIVCNNKTLFDACVFAISFINLTAHHQFKDLCCFTSRRSTHIKYCMFSFNSKQQRWKHGDNLLSCKHTRIICFLYQFMNRFETQVLFQELSRYSEFKKNIPRRVILLILKSNLAQIELFVFQIFFINLVCVSQPLLEMLLNELLISEHIAHSLMINLSLINSESDRKLLLKNLCKFREFFRTHPWELRPVIGIKLWRAQLELE